MELAHLQTMNEPNLNYSFLVLYTFESEDLKEWHATYKDFDNAFSEVPQDEKSVMEVQTQVKWAGENIYIFLNIIATLLWQNIGKAKEEVPKQWKQVSIVGIFLL